MPSLAHLIAAPFVLGGAWCLLHPSSVVRLACHPAFLPRAPRTPAERQGVRAAEFALRCFGSQALLCATCLATMQPTPLFYKAFGAALLPFFAFDVMAVRSKALSGLGGALDGAGNAAMLAACWAGWAAAAGGR